MEKKKSVGPTLLVVTILGAIGILIAPLVLDSFASSFDDGEETDAEEIPEKVATLPENVSIEEYAKLDDKGLPATPEFREKVIEIAYATKKKIEESNVKDHTIELANAKSILEIGGDDALLAFKKEGMKFVHHDGVNMWFTIDHFIGYKNWYTSRGRDFFSARNVPVFRPDGTPHIDASKYQSKTLDLTYDDAKLIYEKTGKWMDGRFFNRPENLILVVWGRNLQQCLNTGGAISWLKKPGFLLNKLTRNQEKVIKKCSSAVREDVASKPSNLGDGHAAIDIKNWREIYFEMIDLGYIGGCKSKMWKPKNKGDGWHFSPVTKVGTSGQEAKCLNIEPLTRRSTRIIEPKPEPEKKPKKKASKPKKKKKGGSNLIMCKLGKEAVKYYSKFPPNKKHKVYEKGGSKIYTTRQLLAQSKKGVRIYCK